MSDEIDKEITTRKVTSDLNTPAEEYRVSEQRTTKVTSNNDNALGLVLVILIPLAIGSAIAAYFFNSRQAPTQIVVPSTSDAVKDNKSTVIERNNTTIKEVAPSSPQPTPRVQVNVPASTVQAQPRQAAPAPTIILQQQPANPAPAPTIILQQPASPASPAPAPTAPTMQVATPVPSASSTLQPANPVQPATPVPSARPPVN